MDINVSMCYGHVGRMEDGSLSKECTGRRWKAVQ